MKHRIRILALALAAAVLLSACGTAQTDTEKTEEKEERITYAVPLSYQAPSVPLESWQGAKWIWVDADTEVNTHGEFRRTFLLDTLPESALVQIACDNKYWMRVNGQSVTVEGGLNRGPNEYDTYYDLLDIAPYLVEGENVLEILVWYWGETSVMTHYITSGAPGSLYPRTSGCRPETDSGWHGYILPTKREASIPICIWGNTARYTMPGWRTTKAGILQCWRPTRRRRAVPPGEILSCAPSLSIRTSA